MNDFDVYVDVMFKLLCSYKPQPLELREYLRRHMSYRIFLQRDVLFRKAKPVSEALYVARGFVAAYGDDAVLNLSGKGSVLADYSFTSQQPSDCELVALEGTVVLGISFVHMRTVYERFPSAEELARLIMADVTRRERLRIAGLKRDAESVVLDFYADFPEFLPPGGLMVDADIASLLLISESTLRNVRARLQREKRLVF